MAKGKGKGGSAKILLNKKSSHGRHAKSASTNKNSKTYKKRSIGQG